MAAQGHHPDWDLAWFDGATAAASLDQAGLLAHDLPAPENLTAAGKTMLSPNGAFIPTGVTLAGVYIDDPQRMAAPPASWSDLTKPTYQGQIGMNDPSISGPTYPMLAGMLDSAGGWPQGKTYVEALKANGLHMFAKNDATLAALQARSISLAIVQSSAAIYFAATHPGLAIVFPKPAYLLPNVMVEAAGLSRAKRADATKFMAFVMRPDIQKLRQTEGEADGDYWPITTDAPAPLPGLPPLASLDTAELNPAHWGGLEDTINRWFSRTMAGG
ncbi:MAG: iron ABC transporter substrate-binding protein [Acidocella sp. 20-61-6]|nr:MAG: iron ABC transporter substrate-binding protein [Acidocella sp. 20-61-6]